MSLISLLVEAYQASNLDKAQRCYRQSLNEHRAETINHISNLLEVAFVEADNTFATWLLTRNLDEIAQEQMIYVWLSEHLTSVHALGVRLNWAVTQQVFTVHPRPILRLFIQAMDSGNASAVHDFLEAFPVLSCQADEYGNSVLTRAVIHANKTEIVYDLLNHGADVNGGLTPDPILSRFRYSAMRQESPAALTLCQHHRPLHQAIISGRLHLARVLMQSENINVNQVDGSEFDAETVVLLALTPLMLAAYFGYSDLVAELIAQGADVHARDARGHTALTHALRFNQRSVINRLLMAHDADVQVIDDQDKNLSQLAREFEQPALAVFLEQFLDKKREASCVVFSEYAAKLLRNNSSHSAFHLRLASDMLYHVVSYLSTRDLHQLLASVDEVGTFLYQHNTAFRFFISPSLAMASNKKRRVMDAEQVDGMGADNPSPSRL